MKYTTGAQYASVSYQGQSRVVWKSEETSTTLTVMPAATAYYDAAKSAPGSLCMRLDLGSDEYLTHVAKSIPGNLTRQNLIGVDVMSLIVALGPLDGADPLYSWVQPRSSRANESVELVFDTCFAIGANRDPEQLARASTVSAFLTTPGLDGTVSQCSVRISLKDVQKRGVDAKSASTTSNGPAVLLTQDQVTSLIASNQASVDVNCSSKGPEVSKYAKDQIKDTLPTLLTRMQSQELSWDQLKGNMWTLGFSSSADTVIDKVRKYSNKTTTTKELGVKASDLGKLGIDAKTTSNNETGTSDEETAKVTIPASIKVYRFSKADLTQTVSMSVREFSLKGVTAATLNLHSRFVEGGVLRTLPHASISTFPPNAITAWWGGKAEELPPGWAFCDGDEHVSSSGAKVRTPDLRGRFLRGDSSAVGIAGGAEASSTNLLANRIFVTGAGPTFEGDCHTNKVGTHCKTLASPQAITNVEVNKTIATLPPYVNVAFICKLP